MSRHVIAFAASSSRRSINRRLLRHACGRLRDAEVELLDLNDYELPLFSVDREDELGEPGLARAFFDKIGGCDGIVISFAEHNGCYSAAYKNLYDWVSRIDAKVWQGKPMVLFATSPGGRGGRGVLDLALAQVPRYGGEVRASLALPRFGDYFDLERDDIRDAGLRAEVEATVNRLFADDSP